MKDTRVEFFRKSLEGLIESMDATVRMARWSGDEVIPDPLKESASRLVDRLGTASRLAGGTFRGSPADSARVNAMLGAMRRLDAAYVAYRQQFARTAHDPAVAAAVLDAEIDQVRSDRSWRAD